MPLTASWMVSRPLARKTTTTTSRPMNIFADFFKMPTYKKKEEEPAKEASVPDVQGLNAQQDELVAHQEKQTPEVDPPVQIQATKETDVEIPLKEETPAEQSVPVAVAETVVEEPVSAVEPAAPVAEEPETAYGRYAGLPIQSAKYLQEMALRLLLHTISVSAARYGRTIRPVLSVGMAFYVRCFVEIHDDKKGVTDLSLNIGHVYQSTKCSTFVTLPHGQMGGKKKNVYQSIRLDPGSCPQTGAPFKVGGPIWLGKLHDQDVVKTALERLSHETGSSPKMEMIATRKRLIGLLASVSEEIDTPLYHTLPDLCRSLGVNSPPLKKIKAAIINAGYQASGYHKEPNAIKTNAPNEVVWDIMRAWAKENPPKKTPPEDSPAAKILAQESTIEVDFTIPKSMQGTDKVARFPQNPEKNWGPKRRANNIVKPDDEPAAKRAALEAKED